MAITLYTFYNMLKKKHILCIYYVSKLYINKIKGLKKMLLLNVKIQVCAWKFTVKLEGFHLKKKIVSQQDTIYIAGMIWKSKYLEI